MHAFECNSQMTRGATKHEWRANTRAVGTEGRTVSSISGVNIFVCNLVHVCFVCHPLCGTQFQPYFGSTSGHFSSTSWRGFWAVLRIPTRTHASSMDVRPCPLFSGPVVCAGCRLLYFSFVARLVSLKTERGLYVAQRVQSNTV